MGESESIASLEHVSVRYGKEWALSDVSAAFPAGAVGLLGPNGAGKSTMLKALLGFVKPDQGRMSVLGLDVASHPLEIRSRIGYMPENDAHIPGMNAVQFVAYCGELAGLPDRIDALERERETLYASLSDPALLRDGSAVVATRTRLDSLEAEIAELIRRWEALETIAAEG